MPNMSPKRRSVTSVVFLLARDGGGHHVQQTREKCRKVGYDKYSKTNGRSFSYYISSPEHPTRYDQTHRPTQHANTNRIQRANSKSPNQTYCCTQSCQGFVLTVTESAFLFFLAAFFGHIRPMTCWNTTITLKIVSANGYGDA